jgi:aldehyde dehydrogenase (NAD+)
VRVQFGGRHRTDDELDYHLAPLLIRCPDHPEREEIFGPVLCILGYDDLDEAVEIANDTDYGLAGYVSAADLDQARAVARRIRAGSVAINHGFDMNAPFGGYKRSGNGREWGQFAFDEYLETEASPG